MSVLGAPFSEPHDPNRGPFGPFVGIGLPERLARDLAGKRRIITLSAEDIPNAGLHELEGAEVGCLLLGSRGDAVDVIAALSEAGYRGTVTVVAPPMPNPRMVEQELKAVAKALKVTLVVR